MKCDPKYLSCWNRKRHSGRVKNENNILPTFLNVEKDFGRTAIIDFEKSLKYEDLFRESEIVARKIQNLCGCKSFDENERVLFQSVNDRRYTVITWAIWMLGGVCVPISKSCSNSDLEYFVQDVEPSIIFESSLLPFQLDYDTAVEVDIKEGNFINHSKTDVKYQNKPAMIVYTSGTTDRPKGVVLTHGNLCSQMSGMIQSWGWTNQDRILHTLPLHHVHGIVNVLMTSLQVGALCYMLPQFDAKQVWRCLTEPLPQLGGEHINVFMGVPTMYAKLIQYYNKHITDTQTRDHIKHVCQSKIRLMVSGSAALPEPVMTRWEEITGHRLLERYGMTEIGMALSNPLHGPRIPGSVGLPFPNVEVCIVKKQEERSEKGYEVIVQGDSSHTTVTPECDNMIGELYVRGPNVFSEYWNKPHATHKSFTTDGYFKTGDSVVFGDEVYKIVGRTSVDIIKSGGYKIGALEIERHILSHPNITDCAVVGVPDEIWGQKVATVLVVADQGKMSVDEIKDFCKDKMSPYQIPKVVLCVEVMPRNAMGKVNKKELVKDLFS
ncbi:hypothetical protein LOTGIDRAFT_179813 [Lottia gigantea]|uniref:AMP-dependent synthetase/ligase domain-containing protein n=1 Tax=Lottia gigantea TaxID=225164 RepID=V3ZQ79_LOTGI|nr:hypothetical protein LOTGIDRAFT_179813 [Lottia gigantea]ESO83031.1 hypothetical protein LOTGIDRAFT_179813 [Lottia gigantea]